MDKRILFFAIAIIIVLAGIFTWKMVRKPKLNPDEIGKLKFKISSGEITQGGSIDFEDNTPGAKTWEWSFGDGESSIGKSGNHVFSDSGDYYIKLTVNDKITDSLPLTVKPLPAPAIDTLVIGAIQGPSSGYVGQKLSFTDKTHGATRSEWKFGESGHIDATGSTVNYTYQGSGNFHVVLSNDKDKQTIRDIKITRARPIDNTDHNIIPPPPPPPPPMPFVPDNIVQQNIQAFASSSDNNTYKNIYNKLQLWTENMGIPVTVNGAAPIDFKSYLDRLSIQGGTIKSLKASRDPATNKIISLSISQ